MTIVTETYNVRQFQICFSVDFKISLGGGGQCGEKEKQTEDVEDVHKLEFITFASVCFPQESLSPTAEFCRK